MVNNIPPTGPGSGPSKHQSETRSEVPRIHPVTGCRSRFCESYTQLLSQDTTTEYISTDQVDRIEYCSCCGCETYSAIRALQNISLTRRPRNTCSTIDNGGYGIQGPLEAAVYTQSQVTGYDKFEFKEVLKRIFLLIQHPLVTTKFLP